MRIASGSSVSARGQSASKRWAWAARAGPCLPGRQGRGRARRSRSPWPPTARCCARKRASVRLGRFAVRRMPVARGGGARGRSFDRQGVDAREERIGDAVLETEQVFRRGAVVVEAPRPRARAVACADDVGEAAHERAVALGAAFNQGRRPAASRAPKRRRCARGPGTSTAGPPPRAPARVRGCRSRGRRGRGRRRRPPRCGLRRDVPPVSAPGCGLRRFGAVKRMRAGGSVRAPRTTCRSAPARRCSRRRSARS